MIKDISPCKFIRDPFWKFLWIFNGNQSMGAADGYNPTYDLWSTCGLMTDPPGSGTDTITPQWIKNW